MLALKLTMVDGSELLVNTINNENESNVNTAPGLTADLNELTEAMDAGATYVPRNFVQGEWGVDGVIINSRTRTINTRNVMFVDVFLEI